MPTLPLSTCPLLRFAILSVTALSPSVALAQTDVASVLPAACAAVEIDADRLACYDTAFERIARDPGAADSAALAAREDLQRIAERDRLERQDLPPRERAAQAFSDLFRVDSTGTTQAALANVGKGSLLDSRWELARDSKLGLFNFRAYKPVYLLPVFWTADRNELPRSSSPDVIPAERQSLRSVEAKFQISFKTKALENVLGDNGDVWMGYTHSSRWQVYNADESRPFRETNYEPEVLLVFRNNYSLGDWRGRMLGIGINHQSNGREDPLSRSWNRVMMNVGLDRENWALMVRPWWRISDGNEDENPGIENFIGRGDATLIHVRNGHEYSLMARHSLRGGEDSRGAVQFDWGFPISHTLRGHVQVFDGYGESLVDYDHHTWSLGLGISLLEWF